MSKFIESPKTNYKPIIMIYIGTILLIYTGAAVWDGVMGKKKYISIRNYLFEIIEGSLTHIAMLYYLPLIIPISLLEKTK
jgi:hypothetical protein